MTNHSIELAPSILAADPMNFMKEIQDAENCGADLHHFDVMDGHFVPNLTYGLPLVAKFKKVAKIPLDVHIMIQNPDEMAIKYVEAGADVLVFHVEAARHHHMLATSIRNAGGRPGVAINPGTSLSNLDAILEDLEVVNVMTVNPGFGGQKFITSSLRKIESLANLIAKRGLSVVIQVDGGVNVETVASIRNAGATRLVAGTAFYGAEDRMQAAKMLRG
ncbi:MAG: ribulose-phosphate 3-epimerase [Pseudobacteriovorax sp.]|nr:ribulose-phosphate 3-epimerase [Pseudobacteriovorax sp.]